MKKVSYTRHALTLLLIASVIIISSCKDKSNNTPGTPGTTTSSQGTTPTQRRQLDDMLKLADPNEVAATINGVDIKEGEVEKIIKPEIDRVKASLLASPEPIPDEAMVSDFMKQIRQEALQQLIIEQLLEEKVKDANIVITKEEADTILQDRLKSESVDMEQFKQVLADNNTTYDEVLGEIQKEQKFLKYIDSQMDDPTTSIEEEAKKYYDDNQQAFNRPEQVKASHILIMARQEEPNDVKQKAKEKIEDLLKQVKEGADFAELAKENSDDTGSAIDGGDLGFFDNQTMVPEFTEAAFALEPNEVSDIVETNYGYHIIKVTDHREGGIIPFDEIKGDLEKALGERKKAEFTNKLIETLLKNADMKFPAGKELNFNFSEEK